MAQIQGGELRPTPSCGPPCGRGGPGRAGLRSPEPLSAASRPDPRRRAATPPRWPSKPGPHAPAAGRPRPPTRCPPRGAARRLCARGPAKPGQARPGPARRGRERALRWPGALRGGGGPATRVRVLLTNGPGARGGRRRGSPAWGPARPWSPSAQRKGRRWLLRSPPPSAPPLSPPGGGARGREPGRTRGEGGRGSGRERRARPGWSWSRTRRRAPRLTRAPGCRRAGYRPRPPSTNHKPRSRVATLPSRRQAGSVRQEAGTAEKKSQ